MNQSSTHPDEQGTRGRKPPRGSEASRFLDIRLAHADQVCSGPLGAGVELGARHGGQALGPAHNRPAFLGLWVPRPASRAWRARELHTLPCAGQGGGGAEDFPCSSKQCIPQPRPRWHPAAVALTSAGQAELATEGRRAEGAGGRGHPAVRTCPLAGVAGKSSSELQEAGVPRFAPKHTDRAEPSADPRPQRSTRSTRFRRLLFAARLCLGPGSYHGMWGCPEQALKPHLTPSTGTSSFGAAWPCVSCQRGPALRRALVSPEHAARCHRVRRSPCGSRAVV